jgi:hypothetical protein
MSEPNFPQLEAKEAAAILRCNNPELLSGHSPRRFEATPRAELRPSAASDRLSQR